MATNGKTVLIIDDDLNISTMYSLKLREVGYTVECAFNGTQAMEKIAAGLKPDLVLLDIIMPGENGVQVLERLVAHPHIAAAKIIIFSNLDQKADIDQNIKSKISDYLLKVDVTPAQMVEKVNKALAQ